jgi:hypothetical protein
MYFRYYPSIWLEALKNMETLSLDNQFLSSNSNVSPPDYKEEEEEEGGGGGGGGAEEEEKEDSAFGT